MQDATVETYFFIKGNEASIRVNSLRIDPPDEGRPFQFLLIEDSSINFKVSSTSAHLCIFMAPGCVNSL